MNLTNSSIKNQKVKDRCDILAVLISGVQEAYLLSTDEQKAFIETTIGAALWYIPKVEESFSGLISKASVESFSSENPQISEEHIYPRKLSASQLLKMKIINGKKVYDLYRRKYCKICLITPEENKRAIKYQKEKIFKTSIAAYGNAGIKLINITKSEYQLLKKNNKEIIDKLLRRREITKIEM